VSWRQSLVQMYQPKRSMEAPRSHPLRPSMAVVGSGRALLDCGHTWRLLLDDVDLQNLPTDSNANRIRDEVEI
jgi:hypothetical protein